MEATNDRDLGLLLLLNVGVSSPFVLSVEVLPLRGELIPLVHEPAVSVGTGLRVGVEGVHALVLVVALGAERTAALMEAIAVHGRHVAELGMVAAKQSFLLPGIGSLAGVLQLRLPHG